MVVQKDTDVNELHELQEKIAELKHIDDHKQSFTDYQDKQIEIA